MKIRMNISISEEAVRALDSKENKSQFIEDLILNGSPEAESKSPLTIEAVRVLIKEEIGNIDFTKTSIKNIDLASLGVKTGDAFVPKPPDPDKGYPCCSGRTPCKHWIWDDMDTEWKNSITGKTREA